MFIATQQKYIPAPAEPNVAGVTHGAPLERESIKAGDAINIWPLRGQIPTDQHTITPPRPPPESCSLSVLSLTIRSF